MFPYFVLSRQVFLSPRKMAFFHRYLCRRLSFSSKSSIFLSPTSVTTRSDLSYYRQFNRKLFYFHHLVGGRVAAVHEEVSLNKNEKRTAIHHRSLVPRGPFARGSVPQMLRYILPPQNRPRSRDAKQILPLTGDSAALARTRMRMPK